MPAEGGVQRVIVDTNVLLAATDRGRRSHAAAVLVLNTDERALVITPQIVREYLVTCTRPVGVNGLGLDSASATANLDALLNGITVMPETALSADLLVDFVRTGLAAGRQIQDANLVATATSHGVDTILTDNPRDFVRYSELIRVEPLTG